MKFGNCAQCGDEFAKKRGAQQYCSKKCSIAARYSSLRSQQNTVDDAHAKTQVTRLCLQCGEEISRYWAKGRRINFKIYAARKFCAKICNQNYYLGRPAEVSLFEFLERLLEKKAADSKCWTIDKKYRDAHGYGRIPFQGKSHKAHRVAYLRAFGDFDKKLHVRHTCDNPPCCNPDHLILGTHADNMGDMAKRERSGRRKLSNAQRLQIKRLYAERGERIVDLATQFLVSRQTIHRLVKNVSV